MLTGTDSSTVDLTRTCVRLRADLRFVPQQYGSTVSYHIEVPSTGEYFRIGYTEYVFVSLLDGRTSFAQALATASQVLGADAISQADALIVYSWLLDHGLSKFVEQASSGGSPRGTSAGKSRQKSLLQRLNPLYLRISFGRPEFLLRAIQPFTGWMFSAPMTLLSCALGLVAGLMLRQEWSRFSANSGAVFAPGNWIWLLVAWVGLKLIHETAHGLVCLRYGGKVGEMGIVLACLAPLPFIDASSCWSFRSRWQRIHAATAGIYVELIVASLAAIGWIYCDSLVLKELLQNVIVMASISTLLFNLNPLMRFDGYFVLSDLLQLPNLYTESSAAVNRVIRRVLLGDSGPAPTVHGRKFVLLLIYGLCAMVWRGLVCVTLLIAASVMFHGAGVALTMAGLLLWFARPAWKTMISLGMLWKKTPVRALRGAGTALAGVSACGVILFLLPAPVTVSAPGIVEYTDGQIVRSTTPGFVRHVHVQDGQTVHAGDLLIELENDEVTGEHRDLEQQILQEELRIQTASRSHDSAAMSIAESNLESLHLKFRETGRKVAGLQLRAEREGRVAGAELKNLLDTFVQEGQELLTLGSEDCKELRISVHQTDLTVVMARIEADVPVRIGTRWPIPGRLLRVNPRATHRLPHPALAATSGGALPVRDDPESAGPESESSLRLTEQRFDAVIGFAEDQADLLRCGERGIVSLGQPGCSIATWCYRSGRTWLEDRLAAAQLTSTAASVH